MTVTDWWHQVASSALLGTTRKPPPALDPALGVRPRECAGPEMTLLDAAAVGGAVRRAARRATAPTTGPAPVDDRPLAPAAAVQLLDLLLTQAPVPAPLIPLALDSWLREADRRGVRAPHRHLPALLTMAAHRALLRPATRAVGGPRMLWLAAQNPDWRWLPASSTPKVRGPKEERIEPDAWRKLPVTERRDGLAALAHPLSDAALTLLEIALDDRAETVRRDARALLDSAPGSDRAARMAARLRPLLSTAGVVRKSLEIDLPTEPDPAGVRDGLGKAPRGSQRAYWLEELAAGAPLEVWTEATGRPPDATVAMIREPAAIAGILRAVRARRDPLWARAMVNDHPDLFELLPVEDRSSVALDLVRGGRTADAVLTVIHNLPAPWDAPVSVAVIERLRRYKQPPQDDPHLLTALAARLHPDALSHVRQWERSDHQWGDLPTALARHLSLIPAITEAFR